MKKMTLILAGTLFIASVASAQRRGDQGSQSRGHVEHHQDTWNNRHGWPQSDHQNRRDDQRRQDDRGHDNRGRNGNTAGQVIAGAIIGAIIVDAIHDQKRPVVCYAQGDYGQIFQSYGMKPKRIQNQAMNQCYAYSYYCRPMGCRR